MSCFLKNYMFYFSITDISFGMLTVSVLGFQQPCCPIFPIFQLTHAGCAKIHISCTLCGQNENQILSTFFFGHDRIVSILNSTTKCDDNEGGVCYLFDFLISTKAKEEKMTVRICGSETLSVWCELTVVHCTMTLTLNLERGKKDMKKTYSSVVSRLRDKASWTWIETMLQKHWFVRTIGRSTGQG